MNFDAVTEGLKSLITGLKTNTWPDAFFSGLLEYSEETIAKLPKWSLWFLIAYIVCAAIALILHYGKKQKSFSDFVGKFIDCICVLVGVMCLWIIPQFYKQGQLMAAKVSGEFAWTKEGIQWLSEWMQAWFDPVFLGIIFLAISLSPLFKVWRYLKEYKLAGIPWAIYDVGLPLVCVCTAILAMANGNVYWYFVILPAIVLVWLGQRGGADVK